MLKSLGLGWFRDNLPVSMLANGRLLDACQPLSLMKPNQVEILVRFG